MINLTKLPFFSNVSTALTIYPIPPDVLFPAEGLGGFLGCSLYKIHVSITNTVHNIPKILLHSVFPFLFQKENSFSQKRRAIASLTYSLWDLPS